MPAGLITGTSGALRMLYAGRGGVKLGVISVASSRTVSRAILGLIISLSDLNARAEC